MTDPLGEDGQPAPDESSPATYPATDTPALPADTDAGTTQALAAFLTITPFLDLHDRAGGAEKHRLRGGLCFALDLLVRAAAITLIFGLIFGVAWKVIAPLPDLQQPPAGSGVSDSP